MSFVVPKLTIVPQMPKEATKAKVSVVYPSPLQALVDSDLSSQTRKAAEKSEKAKAPRGGRKKDPNMPKRPLSAYMFFSQDWRERIKSENPDASFGMSFFFKRSFTGLRVRDTGEVGKLLGQKWKTLDDDDKKVSLAGPCFLPRFLAYILCLSSP